MTFLRNEYSKIFRFQQSNEELQIKLKNLKGLRSMLVTFLTFLTVKFSQKIMETQRDSRIRQREGLYKELQQVGLVFIQCSFFSKQKLFEAFVYS